MATEAIQSNEAEQTVTPARLVRYGFVAVVATCAVNVGVLFAGLAVYEFPSEFVGGTFGPLAVGPVLVNSGLAAVGATLVYGVLHRVTARPNRAFVVVAAGALVLSFGMFASPELADAPLSVFALLSVMHVAAAAVVVAVLLRASRPPTRTDERRNP